MEINVTKDFTINNKEQDFIVLYQHFKNHENKYVVIEGKKEMVKKENFFDILGFFNIKNLDVLNQFSLYTFVNS